MQPDATNNGLGSAARPLRFAVTVEFELNGGFRGRFLELVRENAAVSMRDEPGCSRFDVLTPRGGDADRVLLYEVYDDRTAFEAHLKTAHFHAFDAASRRLVRAKTIVEFDVAETGEPEAGRPPAPRPQNLAPSLAGETAKV